MATVIQKLTGRVMAHAIVPQNGGLHDALRVLCDKELLMQYAKAADRQVKQMITAVKSAKDNKYTSDEEIAQVILDKLEERLK